MSHHIFRVMDFLAVQTKGAGGIQSLHGANVKIEQPGVVQTDQVFHFRLKLHGKATEG